MKKYLGFASLVMVLIVLASSGCGDSKGQARQYMESGDAALARAKSCYDQVEKKATALATGYAAGKNTEPAGVKAKIDEINALMSKAEDSTAKAKTEYRKIFELKAVYDYSEYALVQSEVITFLEEVNSTTTEILGIIKNSSTTGQAPDVDSLTRLVDYLGLLSIRIGELQGNAAQLRKDHKLQ